MSENALETDKAMQVKIIISDKQPKNGDEQVQGMSVSDIDPAILVVRESKVVIRYTKEELFDIGELHVSKNKPEFLDVNEIPPTILDPEKWNLERKKSDTPTENGPRVVDVADHRRRPGDPRERIRKENDGIVLSPQRRSFNSGCFVPAREARTNRPHSPLGKAEPGHIGVREIQPSSRRIGSGRILRDWDYGDKSEAGDNDFTFGRGQPRNNDREERREDRRSFGREFDTNREKEKEVREVRRNGRYSDRRRISEANNRDDEPEWFSSGPISQNDTIELRGFDEHEKRKKLSPSRSKRTKDWPKKRNESSISEEKDKEEPKGRSTPNHGKDSKNEAQPKKKGNAEHAAGEKDGKQGDQSFNFDDILKCDTISGLLSNGVSAEGDSSKSRFSRWFKKESPDKHDSRRSSFQEDNHLIKELLKDISETNISIPGNSESYFAPISPAANTGGILGGKQSGQPINIMEILQKGKQKDVLGMKPPPGAGILSLDELEAQIRQPGDFSANMSKTQQQKPNEEMTEQFKRLLAQAGTHQQPGAPSKPQGMSLLEMLSHSQQQDDARMAANPHLMGSVSPGVAHPNSINDLTQKLQQAQLQKQQIDMLSKMMNAGGVQAPHVRGSPLHDFGVQQSRELLNRPEAQAILQGLKRGEINTYHLHQQLANPVLQPRHRDMLLTILKLHGGSSGYGPSPRVLSPLPPPLHMYQQQQQSQQQQQQQQLRVSPLQPNAMHQRIPSPRELQVHTQNILQRALIKKKLEEQTENYRKKQEMQRDASPNANANHNPVKNHSSPTPLAFTPTSVLRKMTAEKDEGKENKLNSSVSLDNNRPAGRAVTGMRPQPVVPTPTHQWNQQFPVKQQPAGRPIVKANNYQSMPTQTEQFFNQAAQQQQRLYNPQPMQQQQQQQRKQPQQYPINNNQPTGVPQQQFNNALYQSANQQFSQQLTQQQMRAQHQHRPANQMAAQQQPQQGPPSQQQPFQQGNNAWQQFLNSAQQNNQNNHLGRAGADGGDLSPTTTNQLARWFSPDLLERARGGELPSTAGLAQHALSLEEIERQTAPAIHN